jgi:hypothetical protein
MFESLESRQLYSVSTPTITPAVDQAQQPVQAPVEQDVTLGPRKSAGGNASGVMFLTFVFKLVA